MAIDNKAATPEEGEALKEEELFRPLDEICKVAQPQHPLWGGFLFRKTITSLIADPGAGKTTMCYKMAIELSLGRPFLTIMPEEPVKALIFDFESADSLIKGRKLMIHEDNESPGILVYNAPDYYFPQVQDLALKVIKKNSINLVIMDNQTMAFSTHDENDNAEAGRQMRFIRQWVNAADVSFILVHHASKANAPGTRKGTGAYARARLADVLINLEVPDDDKPDLLRWSVSKNRITNDYPVWWLKKNEGAFDLTEPPAELGISSNSSTLIYKAQRGLLEYMKPDAEYKFGDLLAAISADGVTPKIVEHAIQKLYQQGRLVKPRFGFWQRKVS